MENDIEFIKQCVRNKSVFWSYHSNMRLTGRSFGRTEILESIESAEIIEHYPDDFPLPSCLCLSFDGENQPVHYVIAMDKTERNIRFVTVYRPDPDKWEANFKERKKS